MLNNLTKKLINGEQQQNDNHEQNVLTADSVVKRKYQLEVINCSPGNAKVYTEMENSSPIKSDQNEETAVIEENHRTVALTVEEADGLNKIEEDADEAAAAEDENDGADSKTILKLEENDTADDEEKPDANSKQTNQVDLKVEPQAESSSADKEVKTKRRDGGPADLDICRVCTSKDSLGDIFEFEGSVRIADLIVKICPTLRITERDHLPHKICAACVENCRVAYEFKTKCESTDKELRQTLKRSYNKTRRNTDFVIVNCPMSDEEEADEEAVDDDEYKVSQSEVESEPVTSDDSFAPPNKKKKLPKRRGRKPRSERPSIVSSVSPSSPRKRGRKPGVSKNSTPAVADAITPKRRPGRPPKSAKTPGIANVVFIEAPDGSSSDSDDEKPIKPRKTHDCTKCDETFKTGVELREHLQTHKGDLFPCTKCEKSFKSKVYLSNHLERHEQDEKRREEKQKAKELKKQMKRQQQEMQKRKEERSGSAERKKKAEPSPASSGRDLFKCVAPLTSTYWSDSFSD